MCKKRKLMKKITSQSKGKHKYVEKKLELN